MSLLAMLEFLATFATILALLVLFLELGYFFGRRRAAAHDAGVGSLVGAVQGAVLGLLGLLLAFSFGAAASRLLDRQDLIVREANAIGTAYLRADLLPASNAAALRDSLREYTRHRLDVTASMGAKPPSAKELREVERLQGECWKAAVAGAEARPAGALVVVPAVNEVIDVHSLRLAAGMKRLPPLVIGLLCGCSLLAAGVLGLGCGLGGKRRFLMTVPLLILIALTMSVTLDLDNPRAGTLQLSDEPLSAVLRSMAPAAP